MLPKVEKLLMFSCPHENQKSSFFLRFLRKAEENVWPLFPCCPKFFTAILVGEKVTFISPSKKLRTFWFLKKIVPNHQNSTGNHEVRFVHVSGSLQLLPKQTKLSSSVLFGATFLIFRYNLIAVLIILLFLLYCTLHLEFQNLYHQASDFQALRV